MSIRHSRSSRKSASRKRRHTHGQFTHQRKALFEQLEDRRLLVVYTSGDVPQAIPDQGTVESTLVVADSVTIGDLNVTLDISHTRDKDLDVFLVGPDGTRVQLMTDVGGSGNNFQGTILDDEAASLITSGSAPFAGSYRPEGLLSNLDGKSAQGTWTLEVTDDQKRETGTLNSWSIEVTPAGPVLPNLSIDDVQLVEGDSGTTALVFTVSRSGDTSGTSSVDFATTDGTASAGSDYVSSNGTLQFLAGETTKTITVQVNGDTDIEPDESFTVDLVNPANAVIPAGQEQGQGAILDDDGEVFPNDPMFSQQWNLHNTGQTGGAFDADMDMPAAWSVTTGSMTTVVAIIDGGVEYFHEDLYLNMWLNQNEIPNTLKASLIDTDGDGIITFRDLNDPVNASHTTDFNGTGYIDGGDLLEDTRWENGIDEDGNGHTDDLIGWDFQGNDNDPYSTGEPDRPGSGHGTRQAGIIGAIGNNGIGVTGVMRRVQMMPVRKKLIDDVPGNRLYDHVASLNYAVEQGATISNIASKESVNFTQEMYDAIEAAGEEGHLIVAAAGNGGENIDLNRDHLPYFYTAWHDLDNIISVTSTDHNDDWGGDNYGLTSVDLSSPAGNVLTTDIGGTYGATAGPTTSAATPQVTGVAALLRTLHPDWTPAQIKSQILATVDPLPSLAGITVTGGRVNAAAAVATSSIHVSDPAIIEGDTGTTELVFTVSRRGDTSEAVTLDWTTADGTAIAGNDYVAASGTVELLAGETSNTISVQILGDTASELDETMYVNLLPTAGNALLADATAQGIIQNDDLAANAIYIYDIRFESKRGGKDWRAVFEIRSEVDDTPVAGVTVKVDFAGTTYTLVTDSNGIARTSWERNLADGNYYADAYDLALEGFVWNPFLDLEDDSDGDGKPDDLLIV